MSISITVPSSPKYHEFVTDSDMAVALVSSFLSEQSVFAPDHDGGRQAERWWDAFFSRERIEYTSDLPRNPHALNRIQHHRDVARNSHRADRERDSERLRHRERILFTPHFAGTKPTGSAVAVSDVGKSHEKHEIGVGKAVVQSGVARERVFISVRVPTDGYDPGYAIQFILKNLGLKHIDLYLLPPPPGFSLSGGQSRIAPIDQTTLPFQGTEHQRNIGVLDFGVIHIAQLLVEAKIRPAVNQVSFSSRSTTREPVEYLFPSQIKYNPYQHEKDGPIIDLCRKLDITVRAYDCVMPLGGTGATGPLAKNLPITSRRLGPDATPARILLAWTKYKGVLPVLRKSERDRLKDNVETDTLGMVPADFAAIDILGVMGGEKPPADLGKDTLAAGMTSALMNLIGNVISNS
ncbi:unnamed protein product [Mycena citricolor]|uniref:Uncharacterized protein n=1 Tax=Mycena citricolor TaxID=2018698 RepID=A0AAD2HYL5_9AGAR|nr:unnamed protein product [Mycena citricolor]